MDRRIPAAQLYFFAMRQSDFPRSQNLNLVVPMPSEPKFRSVLLCPGTEVHTAVQRPAGSKLNLEANGQKLPAQACTLGRHSVNFNGAEIFVQLNLDRYFLVVTRFKVHNVTSAAAITVSSLAASPLFFCCFVVPSSSPGGSSSL